MKICIACNFKFDNSTWQCPSCSFKPRIINGYWAFAPELADKNDGFNPEAFANLYRIESSNFWFRSRNRLIIWALKKYFPGIDNFLEIGCGTGFVLSGIEQAFQNLSLSGSEIHSRGLAFASKRLKKAKLFQMDARHIPFKDEFDVIGAFDVLEHITEDDTVLLNIYNAVREGGGVILTVPQHRFLWSMADELACHVRRYNALELRTAVECAGFKVAKITSFVSLLMPLMLISRLLKRHNYGGHDDATSELLVSGIKNAVLEKILDMETYLTRAGISLPFGGSLLLVAYKVPERV